MREASLVVETHTGLEKTYKVKVATAGRAEHLPGEGSQVMVNMGHRNILCQVSIDVPEL